MIVSFLRLPLHFVVIVSIAGHARAKFPALAVSEVRRIIRKKCNNLAYASKKETITIPR